MVSLSDVIGVRSSWEAVERNWSRRRTARWVSTRSRALSMASAVRRPISTTSSTSASAKWLGVAETERQRAEPRFPGHQRHGEPAPGAQRLDDLEVAIIQAEAADLFGREIGKVDRGAALDDARRQ